MALALVIPHRRSVLFVTGCWALASITDVGLALLIDRSPVVPLVIDVAAACGALCIAFLRERGVLAVAAASLCCTVGLWATRSAWDRSVDYDGVPVLGELLLLAFTVLVIGHPAVRRPLIPVIGAALAVVAFPFRLQNDRIAGIAGAGIGLLMWAVALAIGIYLRSLGHRNRLLGEQVRLQERLAIARDLHDTVAHHVTGIVVRAQAAQLVTSDHPVAHDVLAEIEHAGGETLRAVRALVGELRSSDEEPAEPPRGEAAPLAMIEALRFDAGELGPPVSVIIDPAVSRVGATTLHAVARIATEGVTNARRHGHHVTHIDVRVDVIGDELVVSVRDDGQATLEWHPGFGVVGMRERAAVLGGSLTVGPHANGGWEVRLLLPCPDGASDHG
jgi:signal transduction histidine kinase